MSSLGIKIMRKLLLIVFIAAGITVQAQKPNEHTKPPKAQDYQSLAKKAPLHTVVLEMSVKHHPNPKEAQKYRIPKIWHGDLDSQIGKDLINCNSEGEPALKIRSKFECAPDAFGFACLPHFYPRTNPPPDPRRITLATNNKYGFQSFDR